MKNKIFLCSLLFIFLVACTKADDKQTIEGKWNLVHAFGSIAGISKEYPSGSITYDFKNGTLTVVNDYMGIFNAGLPTDTYNYLVLQNKKGGDELIVNHSYHASIINVSKDSLVLGEHYIDGYGFVLVK
ncbi:MAG: hypothetical protein IPL08_18840 [Saprospiraceae bacterium]|nr:hypothetical protein [Saprospiraceae bacterium]MBK8670941.1 hypothetical protein [Saprospiraceae bacterium]MBL0101388.1 hypothetical protein [Saprospiraceae bacterium]